MAENAARVDWAGVGVGRVHEAAVHARGGADGGRAGAGQAGAARARGGGRRVGLRPPGPAAAAAQLERWAATRASV